MDPIKGIVDFNISRKLDTFKGAAEYAMLYEELQEFVTAYAEGNTPEIIDALCDIVVLAVGAMHKLGYDPHEALVQTVLEITSRKGSFDPTTGKWQKDLNQDPLTLYKANYNSAKR